MTNAVSESSIPITGGFNGLFETMQIVHHVSTSPYRDLGGCQYDQEEVYKIGEGTVKDYPLSYLHGPDGLSTLLRLFFLNALPREEIAEMILRIRMPGYDMARKYFAQAVRDGFLAPRQPALYGEDEIEKVFVEYLDEKSDEG